MWEGEDHGVKRRSGEDRGVKGPVVIEEFDSRRPVVDVGHGPEKREEEANKQVPAPRSVQARQVHLWLLSGTKKEKSSFARGGSHHSSRERRRPRLGQLGDCVSLLQSAEMAGRPERTGRISIAVVLGSASREGYMACQATKLS